jgi:hypothetical protein
MRNGTESLKKRNYEERKNQDHFRRGDGTSADNRARRINLILTVHYAFQRRPEIFRRKQFIRISGKMEGTITHIAEP